MAKKGQGNIGHTTRLDYTNFFSQTAGGSIIHSGKNGWAYGKTNLINPLKNGGKQVPYGAQMHGASLLKGQQIERHFDLMKIQFDKGLWMFIQALGSHSQRFFQDTFKNKRFPGTGGHGSSFYTARTWAALKRKTVSNRNKLGLMPGKPYGNQLTATGRLHDSIKIDISGGSAKFPKARIYTDPKAFAGAYPEWKIGTKRRKIGKGRSGGFPSGVGPAGNGMAGRIGRVYAGIHNEAEKGGSMWIKGHGHVKPPQRKFMGISSELMSDKVQKLMDDYLFYYIFNASLGVKTEAQNRQIEKNNAKRAEYLYRQQEMRKALAESIMYGKNSDTGSVINN